MAYASVGIALGVLPVSAQTHSPPEPEVLSYRPLEEALLRLQHTTGIDLSYDPQLVARKVTGAVEPADASAETMLRAVLQDTGLYYYRLSSGAYAIRTVTSARSERGILIGYVLDQTSGVPLAEANVILEDADGRFHGTATNATGLFVFPTLRPSSYTIQVSHVGYAVLIDRVDVWPNDRTELFLEMRVQPGRIDPIVVEGTQGLDRPLHLTSTLPENRPAYVNGLGTGDAVRGLNDMVGVRVGDGLADVHIQGGEAGEHQFRLDGAAIFEPVHLRGLLGAFNPFAIGRITAHKAGFGASEGSYLAGVIEAEHALIDTDGHPFDIQADPLSINGRVQWSVGESEGINAQVMAAARQSTWQWNLYRPDHIETLLLNWNTPDQFLFRSSLLAIREDEAVLYESLVQELDSLPSPTLPDLNFSDVHLAGRLHVAPGVALYTSYYRSANRLDSRRLDTALTPDSVGLPNPDRYEWINENAQAQGTFLLASNALLTTRLRSSIYDLSHDYNALEQDVNPTPLDVGERRLIIDLKPADDGNRIREVALESTLDYSHPFGTATMGTEVTRTTHRFSINDVFTRSIRHEERSLHAAFFAEDKLALNSRWTLTGGARFTYVASQATVYAEPRLEVRYDVSNTPLGMLTLRGATGLYRQYLNQFDISSISPSALFPSVRFWIPVDETVHPPKAYHVAGDVIVQPSDRWTLHLESYYKDQPHLLRIDYPALWSRDLDRATDTTAITQQADFLEPSTGYSYGSAFVAERRSQALRLSARYEYNMARREYAFQDTVRTEVVPWNEPHRLEFAMDWTPHSRVIATARWRSGWGRTWGFRRAYYDYLGSDPSQEPIYDYVRTDTPDNESTEVDFRKPAEHVLPAFHQLDLGAAYTHPLGPTALQVRVDVLNALDRDNVADRTLREVDRDDAAFWEQQDRLLLTQTVSFAVRLKW